MNKPLDGSKNLREDCLWTRSLAGLTLFTLREIEVFGKDSGKTAKWNKRTEQLLNENFHDNISFLNEDDYFYVCAICGARYRKDNHKLSFALMKSCAAVNLCLLYMQSWERWLV